MPCNGWNHSTTCDCGWGGMWHGNIPAGGGRSQGFGASNWVGTTRATSIERIVRVGKVRSLTIPNARCPVCGESVFFYQNEYGSRVFFDELGPPWPKHWCTDNEWHRYPTSAKIWAPEIPERERRARWQVDGWHPLEVCRT